MKTVFAGVIASIFAAWSLSMCPQSGAAPPERGLVVVAPKHFHAELAEYIKHKQAQLPTELVALEDIVMRLHHNPRRIFNLPGQTDTYVEVDLDARYEISAINQQTRCGWTPFEGWRVNGRVVRTILRGQTAFEDGSVLAAPGSGKNIRA